MNNQSATYQYGAYAGQAIEIALTIWNPAGWVGKVLTAVRYAQAFSNTREAELAFFQGRWVEAATYGGQALLALAKLPCNQRNVLGKAVSSSVAKVVGKVIPGVSPQMVANAFKVGIQAAGVTMSAVNAGRALDQIARGDIIGGLLNFGESAANIYASTRSCFTGETCVYARGLWGEGWRRIDSIVAGDEVLSRDEDYAHGPLAWKRVEEVFLRWGWVHHLEVGGRTIGTTLEHPFYTLRNGWTPTGELVAGDRIPGMNPRLTTGVDGVSKVGRYAQVFNLRVADYQTYFVGGDSWGFSLWAHNRYEVTEVKDGQVPKPKKWGVEKNFQGGNRTVGILSWKKHGKTYYTELKSGKENAKDAGLGHMGLGQHTENYHHVEAQAIKVMKAEGIKRARLVINNPRGVCEECAPPGHSDLLGQGLPRGSVLEVHGDAGGQQIHLLNIRGQM